MCDNIKYNIYSSCKYLGNENNPYVALIKGNDESITSVELHRDTKIIADGAFYNYLELNNVSLNDTLKIIGSRAFHGCKKLTTIIIPQSVRTIRTRALGGYKGLTVYCELSNYPGNWGDNWVDFNIYAGYVYWYSETQPTQGTDYWHYVNGQPVIW